MTRLPPVATLVVGAAVAVMITLGIWQLQRAQAKDRLLARYAAAQDLPPITWADAAAERQPPLFRHATGICLEQVGRRATAGHNRRGESGYSHILDCLTGNGPGMSVDVGWSRDPNAQIGWRGGPVSGILAPDRRTRIRLVAATAAPGLEPSAPPSLRAIPNNHRSYAVQWFAFAAIALIIYALALRQRARKESPKP